MAIYGVVFGMVLFYAALAKWLPNRAVSRAVASWQSHVAHGKCGSANDGIALDHHHAQD